MTARVHRSEPDQALLRPHRTSMQREREGVIQPMDAPCAKPMSEMSQALIVGFFIGFLGTLAYLVGPYVRSMFS